MRESSRQQTSGDALYHKLLATHYAAQALHGLGLLYAPTDLNGAIRNLRKRR